MTERDTNELDTNELGTNEPGTTEAEPPSRPASPADPAPAALEEYMRRNRGAFTEAALREAALAAGNDPQDVESALARARGVAPALAAGNDPQDVESALARARGVATGPSVDRGRVARNIFLWYLGVYLLLDVLMLINPANSPGGGFLGDVRAIGIVFLSIALGAGLITSLVWVGSRRLFWALVGVGAALSGLPALLNPYSGGPVLGGALVAIGIGMVIAAARVMVRPGVPASPTVALLMSVPMLILLAVGGICVISGLPVPRFS